MMYHLSFFLLKVFSKIPFWLLYIFSDCLFYIIYYVLRYRRTIVRKNITESFPEKSGEEIIGIEKKFYRYFADNLLETCKLATISRKEMKRRMKFTNTDAFNDILRSGKSISLYLGHYGNWEWCSSIPLHFIEGITSAQIYHQLRNACMDRLMMFNRERMGAKCVEMRKTARYVNEQHKANRVCVIGFIADQSPRKKEVRYFLPFLNHSVPVLVGSEKITKHYGYDAWFVRVKRIKRGFYEADLVRMHEDPQSLPDFELTSIYYRMLEQVIQEHPELYLWTHRRFKHAKKLNE
ncbi:MAG: lysophospholipid acyltransferase family protein [Candidatus Paraprevotella stercoravium]|uniref:Lysophospholipid acyltransferase family protein n=2 Tax=Bacteroidales TaxID=171549 RepID=A0ABT7U357_9BACE|nr:lysophospholipid acyltransferase family protein [Candidatus Paraprevotella stercoravium]MDM8144934.1 lysophospholipid acyltransferase family protein [Bacteroides eggerthii]